MNSVQPAGVAGQASPGDSVVSGASASLGGAGASVLSARRGDSRAINSLIGNKLTNEGEAQKREKRWIKRSQETYDMINGLNARAASLTLDGETERAARLSSQAAGLWRCGTLQVYKCGECGELAGRREESRVLGRTVIYQCHSRLCAYCNRVRGEKLAKKIGPVLAQAKYPVKIELTVRNGPVLQERYDHLMRSWDKFSRYKPVREAFAGGAVVVEFTIDGEGNWHPHIHGVVDGSMDVRRMSALWQKATGDSKVVWAKKIPEEGRAGAIGYILKYPFKVSGLAGHADKLEEFLSVVKGRRLVRTFGSFYGLDTEEEETEEEEILPEEEEGARVTCPHCGVPGYMVVVKGCSVARWQAERFDGGWYCWEKGKVRILQRRGRDAKEPGIPRWLQ